MDRQIFPKSFQTGRLGGGPAVDPYVIGKGAEMLPFIIFIIGYRIHNFGRIKTFWIWVTHSANG